MLPKVTVIIVAYNVGKIRNLFKQCLDNTLNLKYDNYEVILVNNGSTDDTNEIIKDYEKDIRIINLKYNVGLPNACNIAFNSSKSDFVLKIDADVIPEQDSLKEVVKEAMKPKIGIVGGIQVGYNKKWISGLGFLLDTNLNSFGPSIKPSKPDEIKRSYYTYIPGSYMLIKRKAVKTLFPKEFFMYLDDVELCMRVWSKGYRVVLIPEVVCAHEFGSGTRAAHKSKDRLSITLSSSRVKNSYLLLKALHSYVPISFAKKTMFYVLSSPILDSFHLFRYLFAPQYYSLTTFFPGSYTKELRYLTQQISTINEYGPYTPLLVKLKRYKVYNYITREKGAGIYKYNIIPISSKKDLDDLFVTDEDIEKSSKKFIVEK